MWAIEYHPKGAVRVGDLVEVVERNRMLFKENKPIEWVVVDLAETMVAASAKRLEIKRIKRGLNHEVIGEMDNGTDETETGIGIEQSVDG